MTSDRSEYLVVVFSAGGSGSCDAVASVRCNRKETAEAIHKWVSGKHCVATVLHDPPLIGQGAA